MTEVLVFVPGILGSELWRPASAPNGKPEKIWPGSLTDALENFSAAEFQELLNPNLEARDIVRTAIGGIVNIYARWLDVFESISPKGGGPHKFSERTKPQTLHVFPYDWRLDIRTSAAALAEKLDQIESAHRDISIHLVAHSMGGLVARAFLEDAQYRNHNGWKKVKSLTTFGTPHNGAPVAFAGIVGQHKTQFLSVQQSMQLAADPRYPSLYQLCPDASQAFLWDARYLVPLDWTAEPNLNTKSIGAWTALRNILKEEKPPHVRYFCFVGSRIKTMTRLIKNRGQRLQVESLDSGGDGTVSLLGSVASALQTEFVGRSHVDLIDTRQARQTLAALFGGVTLMAAASEFAIGSVDPEVQANQPFQIYLDLTPSVPAFDGFIQTQIASNAATAAAYAGLTFTAAGKETPLSWRGPAIDHATLDMRIAVPGLWRLVLLDHRRAVIATSEPFIVQ